MSDTDPQPSNPAPGTGGEPTGSQSPSPAPERDWKAEADKWKALARKHEDTAKAHSSAAQRLAEIEEAQKTAEQKLTDRATAAEREAEQARTKLLRYEIAAKKKLPAEWAARLQGSTPEELEADADQLLQALGAQQQRQTPSYDGGVRKPAPAPTDMNTLLREMAGRG